MCYKTQAGLLGFILLCSVTEKAELFPPSHCGGKMHHFMTCYKMCAFHCKVCRKKKLMCGRKPNIKNRSLKPCHFTNVSHRLPQLSTAKGCSIVTDQTHIWHTYRLIGAQRLLPLSCALLRDLHITSLHTLTQTEACTDVRAHKKTRQSAPPPQKKKEQILCFCDTSNRSVTVMWPCSMQTSQWGLKWGERARVLVFVRVLGVVCAEVCM